MMDGCSSKFNEGTIEYMTVEKLTLKISDGDLSKLIVDRSGGKIRTCECNDGCVCLRGIQSDGDPFWAMIAVRIVLGNVNLEVVDANVDGVLLGFQEWGVSRKLDELMRKVFSHSKSGGRTITIIPLSDIGSAIAKMCNVQSFSLAAPEISLTSDGLVVSC